MTNIVAKNGLHLEAVVAVANLIKQFTIVTYVALTGYDFRDVNYYICHRKKRTSIN